MKRLLIFLCLLSPMLHATSTASGKVLDLGTSAITPGFSTYAQLDLVGCGQNSPVSGGVQVFAHKKFPLAADGTWSGTIYRNDEISCGGVFSTTTYNLTYFVNGSVSGVVRNFTCSQASCAFDTMTPNVVGPAPTPPAQPLTGAESVVCSFPVAASTWTCTENMGTQQVVAQFYDASNNEIFPDTATATDVNTFVTTWQNPQAGFVRVVNVGNWTPSVSNPVAIITTPSSDQSIIGDHALAVQGTLSAKRVNGCRVAGSLYSGADVFAQANSAAIDAGSPGCVIIPPGTYNSVTTTLACVNGVTFQIAGVTVNYSGSGNAIKCQNVENAGISGPALINGPGTGGSTIGLLFGIGSSGTGVVTTYNTISDIQFTAFNTACKVEGSGSNNGTYTNTFRAVYCNNSNRGWDWFPTSANFANANTCIGCAALGNLSDGFRIDGANGNWCIGCRSELNGGYGFNFSGTRQTNSDTIQGGWSEANTLGDTNWGSVANVTQTQIISLLVNSTPNVVGTPGGLGNRIEFTFSAARFIDWYSGVFNYHVSSQNGTGFQWAWVNEESPSSGITTICGLNRNSANNGQFYCGTPEYPFTARSAIDANGNQVKGVTNLQSNTANPAGAGLVRAASIDSLGCWRNNAGSADICLSKSAGDIVQVPAPVNINNTTAITSNSFYTTGSVTPSGVGAQTCSDQTFTVSGLSTADRISSVVPPSTLGNVSLNGYASASNTVLLHFCNPSAITVTPPAGVYQFQAMH